MSRKFADEEYIDGFDDDINSVVPFNDTITSYGADFPVESLVKRIHNQDVYVPDFQRRYVWKSEKASRFIESLLLGLPVPGVFLAKDINGRHMIIDGQQRLLSVFYFVTESNDFRLKGVGELFNGCSFSQLPMEYQTRLLDSIIHATIVRQDNENFENSSIFHLFERLNTGGKELEPQEIRNCMYPGEFREAISNLNKNKDWRELYGNISPRYKDEELILRFLALYQSYEDYTPPLKSFLNKFMGRNRDLSDYALLNSIDLFSITIQLILKALGTSAFKPSTNFNAAIFDSVMVGLARRVSSNKVTDVSSVRDAYLSLLENTDFITAYKESTASKISINTRISLAIEYFKAVK